MPEKSCNNSTFSSDWKIKFLFATQFKLFECSYTSASDWLALIGGRRWLWRWADGAGHEKEMPDVTRNFSWCTSQAAAPRKSSTETEETIGRPERKGAGLSLYKQLFYHRLYLDRAKISVGFCAMIRYMVSPYRLEWRRLMAAGFQLFVLVKRLLNDLEVSHKEGE